MLAAISATSNVLSEDFKNLIAGLVGGAAIVYSGHPLDLAKVQLQTSHGHGTVFGCLRDTAQKHGLRSLNTGATASLYSEAAVNALTYGLYQAFKRHFEGSGYGISTSSLLAGCATGAIAAGVEGPLELIKIRMQMKPGLYSGVLNCAQQLVRVEGPGVLTTGLPLTLVRNVPMIAAYYYAYDWGRAQGLGPLPSGALSGVACWAVALPIDTIKSKMQACSSRPPFSSILRQIMQDQGPGGLFRGWRPVFARAALVNACGFQALEITKSLLSLE